MEVLHEEFLGIVEFHEVVKNFLKVVHKVLIVVVLYEIGIVYLPVHSNRHFRCSRHFRSLHEVVRKLPAGLLVVILHFRYWSDVLHFYFAFDIFCMYFLFIFVYLFTLRNFSKE